MPKIEEGDEVLIRATVTRVSDDGAEITVRLPLYGYPVTLAANSVEEVIPKARPRRRKPLHDKPD